MATNQGDLKNAVARREGNGTVAKPGGYASVEGLLEKYREEIVHALPGHMAGEQFMRLILQEFRLNPKLLQCDPASILGAVFTCARLGLEPGPLQLVYLIPYNRRVKQGNQWVDGPPEAQVQIGYRGFVALAYRTDKVESIIPYTINEHDTFAWHGGHQNEMIHEIPDWQNRGKVLGYYMVVRMKGGGTVVSRPWSVAEIETHRKKHAQTRDGAMTPAWQKSYDVMAAKTVFRDMIRWMPVSTELLNTAERVDGAVLHSKGNDNTLEEMLASAQFPDMTEIDIPEEPEDGTASAGPSWEEQHPFDDKPADGTLPV